MAWDGMTKLGALGWYSWLHFLFSYLREVGKYMLESDKKSISLVTKK